MRDVRLKFGMTSTQDWVITTQDLWLIVIDPLIHSTEPIDQLRYKSNPSTINKSNQHFHIISRSPISKISPQVEVYTYTRTVTTSSSAVIKLFTVSTVQHGLSPARPIAHGSTSVILYQPSLTAFSLVSPSPLHQASITHHPYSLLTRPATQVRCQLVHPSLDLRS